MLRDTLANDISNPSISDTQTLDGGKGLDTSSFRGDSELRGQRPHLFWFATGSLSRVEALRASDGAGDARLDASVLRVCLQTGATTETTCS
jgi:hypothetical protein